MRSAYVRLKKRRKEEAKEGRQTKESRREIKKSTREVEEGRGETEGCSREAKTEGHFLSHVFVDSLVFLALLSVKAY